MAFVKTHIPCPSVVGAILPLNDDGSLYCFSCDKLIPIMTAELPNNTVEFKTYKNNIMNTSDGSFNAQQIEASL